MTELFSKYAESGNIRFKYAKGVSDRVGKEFHLFHEIIWFLGGDAELISETMHIRVEPDSVILIPKETYHQFVIHGDQREYFRCVMQFGETKEMETSFGEDLREVFVALGDDHLRFLFQKGISLAEEDAPSSRGILEAILVLVLDEIRAKKRAPVCSDGPDGLTKTTLHYISEHLTGDLALKDMAAMLNVSLSTLTKTFKKNMNISIHKYVLQKRLILAHKEISSGKAPSEVAVECGFADYSGFYRQYKKMFEVPPSFHRRGRSR